MQAASYALVVAGHAETQVKCLAACSGTASIIYDPATAAGAKATSTMLGSSRFKLARPGQVAVTVKLNAAGRRLVSHRKLVQARLSIALRMAKGKVKTYVSTIELTHTTPRPKKKK